MMEHIAKAALMGAVLEGMKDAADTQKKTRRVYAEV